LNVNKIEHFSKVSKRETFAKRPLLQRSQLNFNGVTV